VLCNTRIAVFSLFLLQYSNKREGGGKANNEQMGTKDRSRVCSAVGITCVLLALPPPPLPLPLCPLNADPHPDPGSQTNADQCGSGSAQYSGQTLLSQKVEFCHENILYVGTVICQNHPYVGTEAI